MARDEVAPDRAKVTVSLVINAVVEVTDEGYLGVTARVEEHIKKAREDAANWQWFVKKGGTEPVPVKVRVTVNAVSIIPEEK